MGLNPPLSHIKHDASSSPIRPPFSDSLPPRRTGSRTPSSASNSSLSTSPSSFLASPIDSPFHLLHSSSSSVPFSWERRPGIPKLPAAAASAGDLHLLPLPPPLRSAVGFSRNKRSGAGGGFDPFAVALAQCAKECSLETGEEDIEGLWWRRSGLKREGIWRRAAIADRIGLISFYGSCKATCSVSDATIVLPRAAGRGAGLYGQMNRRRV